MKIGALLVAGTVAVIGVLASEFLLHPQSIDVAAGKAVAAISKPKTSTLHDEIMQEVPSLVEGVKERVNDPQSVVFRDVAAMRPDSVHDKSYVICGYMNARNAMGGYGDFVTFVKAGTTLVVDNPPIFGQFCDHASLIERIDLH